MFTLVALVVLGFWRQVFHRGYSLVNFPDMRTQWYPWFAFLSESLRRNSFPLWNPHAFSGDSFIGEPQVGLFYPPTLLLALLASGKPVTVRMFSIYIVAHCVLAACGAYGLARQLRFRPWASVTSGLLFGFGGYVMSRTTGQLNLLIGAAFVPISLWLWLASLRSAGPRRSDADRGSGTGVRSAALLAASSGAATGLGILAGHLQPAVVTMLLMPVLALPELCARDRSLARDHLLRLGLLAFIAVVFAAGAAAVQLVPTAYYMRDFARWYSEKGPWPAGRAVPYELVSEQYRATPSSLLDSLIDPFPAVPLGEGGQFIGGLACFLAIAAVWWARQRALKAALAALTVGAFLVSLGKESVLHGLLVEVVPGVALTRSPARMTLASSLSLALLAGLGVQTATGGARRRRREIARALLIVSAAMLALWVQSSFLAGRPQPAELFAQQALIVGSAGAGLLFLSRGLGSTAPSVLLALLVLHQLYTGVIVGRADAPESPVNFFAPNPITQYLREHAGASRIVIVDEGLGGNSGTVLGVDEVLGYKSGMPQSYLEFMGNAWRPSHPAFPLLGCNYVVTRDPGRDCPGWPELARWNGVGVYGNPSPFPRYWFTTDFEVVPREEMLARLQTSRWDSFDRALLSSSPKSLRPAPMAPGREARIATRERPGQRLELEIHAPSPGILVLGERFDLGWRFFVNGVPAQQLRAFHAFTALELPAGESRVAGRYWPVGLGWGISASALAWCSLLVGWGAVFLRPRAASLPP